MKIVLTIAILLLALIASRSQDYHPSPAYYPIEVELPQVWQSTEPLGADIGFLDPEYGSALPTFWQKYKKGLLITAIQFGSVIADAAGDAVYDMGKEAHNDSQMFWGHTLQAVGIGGMGMSVAALSWKGHWTDGLRFGVSWIAMRYAMHDLSYNLTRGIDPLYADGVKAKMQPAGIVITQTLAFALSVSWNIKEF